MNAYPKLGNPAPQRIVILRALQLGDLLCSVPAFRALRAALPEATITLVGLPWAREFVRRFDYYLDDFIEFPGFPGFPERLPQIKRIPEFLTEMQWLEFDLALQMQGSGNLSNSLVQMFAARQIAGFYMPGQFVPQGGEFLEYPVEQTEVWRHLRLMEFLGIPLQGDDLEFPLYKKDWDEVRRLERMYNFQPGEYVCLHPGSRSETRRWPVEHFAALARQLVERGLKVMITGTGSEADLAQGVETQAGTPVLNLAGKTSLGGVAALLSGARLLICNDTGVSHVAAALRTPSVVLFTGSDPNRWAPKNSTLHRAIAWGTSALPELVMNEANDLLQKERAYVIQ